MKKSLGKSGLKAIAAGSLAVALFGGVFIAANNYVLGSSMNNPMSIPTSYETDTDLPEKSSEYEKVDYTVLQNELLSCGNTNALSADEAAEIGAQYLSDVFQADLNGKVIYMSFTEDPSRGIGYWNGDVYEDENEVNDSTSHSSYGFSIEAVSGKRNCVLQDWNKLENENTILYKESDAEIRFKDSIEECLTLAKTAAKKQLSGEVIEAKFKSTGSVLAPGYVFEMPEGATATIMAAEPIQEEPDLIKVSTDDEYEASCVFINILVTDTNGNQVEVEYDMASKSLIFMNEIYSGIDYNPDSIG